MSPIRRPCARCKNTCHVAGNAYCHDCERNLKEKAAAETPLRVFALGPDPSDPLRAVVSASAMLAGLGGRIARA